MKYVSTLIAIVVVVALSSCKKCYKCKTTVYYSGTSTTQPTSSSSDFQECFTNERKKNEYQHAHSSTTTATSGNVTIHQTVVTSCN